MADLRMSYILLEKRATDSSLEIFVQELLTEDTIDADGDRAIVENGKEYLFEQRILQKRGTNQCYVEISAKGKIKDVIHVLTNIDNRICRSPEAVKHYYVITEYDGLSQHYCNELYPKYAIFERTLRSIIYTILVKTFGYEWYNETVKKDRIDNGKTENIDDIVKKVSKGEKSADKLVTSALEEMDIETMRRFLFLPYRDVEPEVVVKDLLSRNPNNESVDGVYKILRTAEEKTIWGEYLSELGDEKTWNDIVDSVRKSRNIVAHSKTLTFDKYEEYRKEINRYNRKLRKLHIDLQEEKFKNPPTWSNWATLLGSFLTTIKAICESDVVKEIIAGIRAWSAWLGSRVIQISQPEMSTAYMSSSVQESMDRIAEMSQLQMNAIGSTDVMESFNLSAKRFTEVANSFYLKEFMEAYKISTSEIARQMTGISANMYKVMLPDCITNNADEIGNNKEHASEGERKNDKDRDEE